MDTLNCCFYGNWVNSEPSEASWAAQMALKTKCSHLNTEKSLQSLRRESNCLHFCISVFFFFSLGSCVTLPASSVAAVEGGSHGLFNLPNTQLSTRPLNLCFLLWALAESVVLGQQTSSGWAHCATGPQQLLLGTLPGPAARKGLEGELLTLR